MEQIESVYLHIGIKIDMSDLIDQIDESNIDLIKKILKDGIIDDENEYYNEVYRNIVNDIINYEIEYSKNEIEKFKDNMMEILKTNGNLLKSRYNDTVAKEYLDDGTLYDQSLLYQYETIISSSRQGYDRYGTNCSSCSICDYSPILNKINKIFKNKLKDYEIVMILEQYRSG